MNTVIIRDDRPAWMRKEDLEWVCLNRCRHILNCKSRMGLKCQRLGGQTIPIFSKR